jgi:alpha-L-glutamate ligase-like protein
MYIVLLEVNRLKKLDRVTRDIRVRIADRKRFKPVRKELREAKKENNNRSLRDFFPLISDKEFLLLKERNRDFIHKYNKREDLLTLSKLELKSRLFCVDIKMPKTLMVISDEEDLFTFENYLLNGGNSRHMFVIKPDKGHIGKGILPVVNKVGRRYITNDNRAMELGQVTEHVRRILIGRFSKGRRDIAFMEELIVPHKSLRDLYSSGLLDIRVIVLLGYPVMAMARLPTMKSRGKANLHRGAVGAGINLATGEITRAIYRRHKIETHPDTKRELIGFRFPDWHQILLTSARAQVVSGLGYVGVDIVIDKNSGILVMEVNKRPGLEIQIANRAGLSKRLKFIEKNADNDLKETEAKVKQAIEWDINGWE